MAETLLIVFIVCILLGMPISIALGTGALGAAMLFPALNPIIIPTRFVGLLSDSYLLLSAPLFILAGNIAARGGVARVLIDLATVLVGRFRGGLAYVNVLDSMFFGGISGSAVADVSALGTFLIPQMVRKGYDLDFATALTISTAVVAPIIPPSIIAVIYAWMADESVAAMFSAGMIPGILVGVGMAVPVFFIARKRNYPKEAPPTLAQFMAALRNALPALMIPVIIMGGILFGWFTPTEAAAVAVVYALGGSADLLSRAGVARAAADLRRFGAAVRRHWHDHWLRRRVRLGADLFEIPVRGGRGNRRDRAGMVAVLAAGHRALYHARHFPHAVGDHPGHGAGAAAGGQAAGVHPIHFGMVCVVASAIGHITPPVGLCLFVGMAISGLPMEKLVRPLLPFLAAIVAVLAVPGLRPGDRPVFAPRPRFHAVDHSVNFRHIEYQVRFGGPTGKHLLAVSFTGFDRCC